jgi:ribosomal subunit interface protein
MKITIKATNLKLTSALRNYVEEKIGGLERFIQGAGFENKSSKKGKPPVEIWVEIGKTTHHHHKGKVFRAEGQMKIPGKSLRAESIKEDLHLAIDDVRSELQRELKNYLKKKGLRYRKTARRIKDLMRFSSLARFRRR